MKYDKFVKREESSQEVTAPQTHAPMVLPDPLVFMTGVIAHAMLVSSATKSAIPRQSIDMAGVIIKELERFYNATPTTEQ